MCFSILQEGNEDFHLALFTRHHAFVAGVEMEQKITSALYCPMAHATSSPWE